MKIKKFKLKKRKGNIFPIFLFIIVTIFGMLLLLQNTSNRILTINQKARFQTNYVAQVGLDMILEATQRYPVEMYEAAANGVPTGDILVYDMPPPTGSTSWATLPTPNGTANVDIQLVSHLDSMGNIAEVEVVSTAVYGETTSVKSMRMYVVDRTITAINSPFENINGSVNDYFTAVPDGSLASNKYPYVKGRYPESGAVYTSSGDSSNPQLFDDNGLEILDIDNTTNPLDTYENYDQLTLNRTFTDTNNGSTIKEKTAQNMWITNVPMRFPNGMRFNITNDSDSSELRSDGNTFIGIDAGFRFVPVTIKDYIKTTGKKDTNIVVDTEKLIIDGLTTPKITADEAKRKGIITTSAEEVIIKNIPSAKNNSQNIFDYYLYAPNAKIIIQNSDGAVFTGSIVAKQLVVYRNGDDVNPVYDSRSSTKKLTALRNIVFSDKNYQGDFYTEIGKKYETIPLTNSIPNYEFIFVEYR